MAKLFISHSGTDIADVRQLAEALDQVGIEPLWLERSTPSGDSLLDSADAMIGDSNGVIVLILAKSKPSPLAVAEWESALAASWSEPGKRLIPVVEAGAKPPAFLSSYAWVKVPAVPTDGRWRDVARSVADSLARGADSEGEEPYRSAARGQWRDRLRSVGAAVEPLAKSEREGS